MRSGRWPSCDWYQVEKHNVTAGVAAAGVGICVRKLLNKSPGSFGSLGLASGSGVSLPFFEMKDLLHFICGREEKRILKKRKEKKRKERKERKRETFRKVKDSWSDSLARSQRPTSGGESFFSRTSRWRKKRKGKGKKERPKEEWAQVDIAKELIANEISSPSRYHHDLVGRHFSVL